MSTKTEGEVPTRQDPATFNRGVASVSVVGQQFERPIALLAQFSGPTNHACDTRIAIVRANGKGRPPVKHN